MTRAPPKTKQNEKNLLDSFNETPKYCELMSSKPSKMRFESGKASMLKTEKLAHLTYPHAESGM